jgi:hypothetical protein
LRVLKVSYLSVTDFVAVRSRGTNYSLATITVDGVKLASLHIVGTIEPNSGNEVFVVLRGSQLASLVGWRDPITGEVFVTIPGIMAFYPLIVLVMIPLFIGLFLAVPSHQWLWFSLFIFLFIFLQLLPAVGWPGVTRMLRRHSTKASE